MDLSLATRRYTSDVDDTAWMVIEPLVQQKPGRGRKRTVTIREVLTRFFISITPDVNGKCYRKNFLIIATSITIIENGHVMALGIRYWM
ncbi:MAG: hypothetical protein M3R61_10685 [Chloroflexota bacterium]|nr:hypothetical protein [Chloroflexota bacterium]